MSVRCTFLGGDAALVTHWSAGGPCGRLGPCLPPAAAAAMHASNAASSCELTMSIGMASSMQESAGKLVAESSSVLGAQPPQATCCGKQLSGSSRLSSKVVLSCSASEDLGTAFSYQGYQPAQQKITRSPRMHLRCPHHHSRCAPLPELDAGPPCRCSPSWRPPALFRHRHCPSKNAGGAERHGGS